MTETAQEGPQLSLDPEDWAAFSRDAHATLDAALARMRGAAEGPVWTPPPGELKAAFAAPLPRTGLGRAEILSRIGQLLPHGVGNTHPRFFGWVHGAGTPGNLLAEIAAAAMNANLGGRDHGAIYVERQVIAWCREIFGFPETASGLVVSGTSLATIIALKAARDRALGYRSRREGLGADGLVGYASRESHACVARAFDLLGLGSDALRRVPVDSDLSMDIGALGPMIAADRAAGRTPFLVVGTAGTVNTGAIDDLAALADIAGTEGLWLHVDGAFGALTRLSARLRPLVAGIERASSLAFDFHKWMQVNYDAGCVLIRSEEAHRRAFADRPDYLKGQSRGLAAGSPWPVDYGPELSRGFRALKVWAQIAEHGTERLGQIVERNCDQAAWLGRQVAAHPDMELLAPVSLNICCFRPVFSGQDAARRDRLTEELVTLLQIRGIAAPSTTRIGGKTAIRVNITNHRTRTADLGLLLDAVADIARELAGGDAPGDAAGPSA